MYSSIKTRIVTGLMFPVNGKTGMPTPKHMDMTSEWFKKWLQLLIVHMNKFLLINLNRIKTKVF